MHLNGIPVVLRDPALLQRFPVPVHLHYEGEGLFNVIILVELGMQPEPDLRRPVNARQLHVGKISGNRGGVFLALA